MTQQAIMDGFTPNTKDKQAKLQAQFIVPPFSILDTRQGYWQERKRLWLSLGIQSEVGRDAKAYSCNDGQQQKYDYLPDIATGTSIFDPVLCELMYRWFCVENGKVFDPFAGGSVRGIIASILGYSYDGIDLSAKQIKANKTQVSICNANVLPNWYVGDSKNMDNILPEDAKYDFVFSCPPYHDLEVYTDDMDDLSRLSWDAFKRDYNDIIAKSILKLNNNRFACFVVSEIRDKLGCYKGLVPYTVQCFNNNGMRYYNEVILVNSVGTLPIRISSQFSGARKIGRTHQNILVFYKGDPNNISKHFKNVNVGADNQLFGGENG